MTMKSFFHISVCLFILSIVNVHAENMGKSMYQLACKNCHAPNLAPAIKAPAAFDKKAWDKRFNQATKEVEKNPKRFKNPFDYLLYHVKMGKGLMHHGGLCNESDKVDKDCSDAAYIDAIKYMSGRK